MSNETVIRLDMSIEEAVEAMAENDDKARTILKEILGFSNNGVFDIMKLDALGLRGEKIVWVDDYVSHDKGRLLALIESDPVSLLTHVYTQQMHNMPKASISDPFEPRNSFHGALSLKFRGLTDGKTARIVIDSVEADDTPSKHPGSKYFIIGGRRTDLPEGPAQKFRYFYYGGEPEHLKPGMEVLVYNSKNPVSDPSEQVEDIMAVLQADDPGIYAWNLQVPKRVFMP